MFNVLFILLVFLTHQTNYLKVKKISVFFSNEGPRPLLRGGSYRINASIQTSSEENISSQKMNLEDELNIQFNIGICKKKNIKTYIFFSEFVFFIAIILI